MKNKDKNEEHEEKEQNSSEDEIKKEKLRLDNKYDYCLGSRLFTKLHLDHIKMDNSFANINREIRRIGVMGKKNYIELIDYDEMLNEDKLHKKVDFIIHTNEKIAKERRLRLIALKALNDANPAVKFKRNTMKINNKKEIPKMVSSGNNYDTMVNFLKTCADEEAKNGAKVQNKKKMPFVTLDDISRNINKMYAADGATENLSFTNEEKEDRMSARSLTNILGNLSSFDNSKSYQKKSCLKRPMSSINLNVIKEEVGADKLVNKKNGAKNLKRAASASGFYLDFKSKKDFESSKKASKTQLNDFLYKNEPLYLKQSTGKIFFDKDGNLRVHTRGSKVKEYIDGKAVIKKTKTGGEEIIDLLENHNHPFNDDESTGGCLTKRSNYIKNKDIFLENQSQSKKKPLERPITAYQNKNQRSKSTYISGTGSILKSPKKVKKGYEDDPIPKHKLITKRDLQYLEKQFDHEFNMLNYQEYKDEKTKTTYNNLVHKKHMKLKSAEGLIFDEWKNIYKDIFTRPVVEKHSFFVMKNGTKILNPDYIKIKKKVDYNEKVGLIGTKKLIAEKCSKVAKIAENKIKSTIKKRSKGTRSMDDLLLKSKIGDSSFIFEKHLRREALLLKKEKGDFVYGDKNEGGGHRISNNEVLHNKILDAGNLFQGLD